MSINNISTNIQYPSASPIFQEENSSLPKRRRIIGEEEAQLSMEMIELSEGSTSLEMPLRPEMTPSSSSETTPAEGGHIQPKGNSKRKRNKQATSSSENQEAILSVFKKTAECIANGTLKREENPSQQEPQKPGYQKPRWDTLLKGLEIEASTEDQIEAAHALFFLTQTFLTKWFKPKFVSAPDKESPQDGVSRRRWEAIDQAITPEASIEIQRHAVGRLQALFSQLSNSQKCYINSKPDRVEKQLFYHEISQTKFSEPALLLVIEKASQHIVETYVWNLAKSQNKRIQNPRWLNLLQGVKEKATEEEQGKAAKSLAALTQDMQPFYKQETTDNQNRRIQWDAVSEGIQRNATELKKQEAVKQLDALLIDHITLLKPQMNKKAKKQTSVANTAPSVPQTLQKNKSPSEITIFEPALLLVIEKASGYINNEHVWNPKKTNDRKVQGPRWTTLLNGVEEKSTPEQHEEAAKSLAALTQDIQPRYVQENIRKTATNQKRKTHWNAVNKGIQSDASESVRQEAVKHLHSLLHLHINLSKAHIGNKGAAKKHAPIVSPIMGFPSTPQESLEDIPQECLLTPLPEFDAQEQTFQCQMAEAEQPDYWSNFIDLSCEEVMRGTGLMPNVALEVELPQSQATEFEPGNIGQEAPQGAFDFPHQGWPLSPMQEDQLMGLDTMYGFDMEAFLKG